MSKNDLFSQCVEKFIKINNELSQIQKKPVSIMKDISISTSALHLLEMIGNYPESTITELSEKLGVTKGSISQQIPKLLQLELIRIEQKNENKKNKLIVLTKQGEIVNDAHEKLHKELYSSIQEDLSSFSSDQMNVILEILDKVSFNIDHYQNQLTKENKK